MNKTWMPKIAGILDVIIGAFYGGGSVYGWIYYALIDKPSDVGEAMAFEFVIVTAIFCIPAGILAIVGGINAIKRKKWVLALSASIAVLIPSIIFAGMLAATTLKIELWFVAVIGIVPIVLTVLSKKEFEL